MIHNDIRMREIKYIPHRVEIDQRIRKPSRTYITRHYCDTHIGGKKAQGKDQRKSEE